MSSRDFRIDRAKGILIFTVVLGHLLARTGPWESPILGAPMYLIYSFHMPAFVFLAGITAKSNRLAERVLTYFVLLATVLPLMWVWMWAFGLNPDYSLLTPFWYTWFLLSMAWWMITVPFIEWFPRTMLVASLVMGLFGGILPILDTELSAARTMAFWPFFVIGKLYGKQIIGWAGSLAIWQKLGLSFAALATIGYFYFDDVDYHWLYGSLNFAHFDVGVPEGVGLRLIMDIAAMLMGLALLSWLSNTKDTFARIGRNSLAVYVLHGFVVRGLQPVLDDSRNVLHDAIVLLICVALAVVWTGLLSWSPFERALRWWSSTITGLLLKPFPFLRREPSGAGTRSAEGSGARGAAARAAVAGGAASGGAGVPAARGSGAQYAHSDDAHVFPGTGYDDQRNAHVFPGGGYDDHGDAQVFSARGYAHPGDTYAEGDGPSRHGFGVQPLPGAGYDQSAGYEQTIGQPPGYDESSGYGQAAGDEYQPSQQGFASPSPDQVEQYPLPGTHQVPQNNATYETTQEVPADAAQRAVRYRRLPVYLSTPPDDER
ncbi:acyltransferase family protein [Brevibacterium atlanticum]|uniref:acyltransferase family protein n=1 Tax=Brevibacterium atlanticum TaxID=2697563 RepID=UPI00141DE003|nr:acyltransferase family protein [Brevibacterium atlanticum]